MNNLTIIISTLASITTIISFIYTNTHFLCKKLNRQKNEEYKHLKNLFNHFDKKISKKLEDIEKRLNILEYNNKKDK